MTRPAEPIERDALVIDDCRYWLFRRWSPGQVIFWGGLNPSRANAYRDDPTMWREMSFSNAWGFGALLKCNVYAFQSASPMHLRIWLQRISRREAVQVGRNIAEIGAKIVEHDCRRFIAAWGSHADTRDVSWWHGRIEHAAGRRIEWECLGTNQDRSPRHTLSRGRNRIADDAQPSPWRSS